MIENLRKIQKNVYLVQAECPALRNTNGRPQILWGCRHHQTNPKSQNQKPKRHHHQKKNTHTTRKIRKN